MTSHELLSKTARLGVPTLTAWSLVVWGSRIRNILGDDLAGVDLWWRLGLAGGFVILALWVVRSAYGLWRDGASDPLTCVSGAALALAVANVVVWPVRAYQILLGEWSSGFKAVHTVLAVVSVVLGLLVLFHRYGRAGHRPRIRHRPSVADPV
ncbi:MAG: hypothetical protein HKN24_05740 [Acidimicrobiales bacterium]|nr:hypothetical protein [Acidimicrobiales bacterium]